MPIQRLNRVHRNYVAQEIENSAEVFLSLIENIKAKTVFREAHQVNLTLMFEDLRIMGDTAEARSLLPQAKDEVPQGLSASLVQNANPRRTLSVSYTPQTRMVVIQTQNVPKSDAELCVSHAKKAFPPADKDKGTTKAQNSGSTSAATQSPGDYLPGPFRPQRVPEPSDKDVFVIMSFADEHRDAYHVAIEPVLSELGFHAVRIDEVQHNRTVTPEILKYIESSVFVVADLTGERPNVYYEVGWAHRADKEVILAAKKGTAVHFDVAAINRIEYDDYTQLREALRKRIKAVLGASPPPSNDEGAAE